MTEFTFYKPFGKFPLLCIFLLFLPSCVTIERDILYLNDQVKALNTRVNKIEGSVSNELDSNLASIRERQAEMGAEIHTIRQEMQNLSGQVDDYYRTVRLSVERDTTEQDAVKAGVADLAKRISDLENSLRQVDGYLGLESVDSKRRLLSETPGEKPPPENEERPSSQQKAVSPDAGLYDITLRMYREGQYEKAIDGFSDFLKKYPNSDLADNAQFWIGECYMALKQFEQAILAYQEVIKKYPKGNKVPNALLRQALAFGEINDKISSQLLLKKVIKDFPNSSEAKIAEAKLKTIK
ncbi:MAG: tol-pal system protein YbgF [Deltaproteobacteria bacterium]|nr:tol-pal system protein YbgF [Deltaproteobacteria bacterium]